jgi:aerobic carbon-monoxide dehydrogenase large subunit
MSKDNSENRHVKGLATFVDDISLPHMAYVGFVRSSYAHAKIQNVNFENLPAGVIATLSGKDIDKYSKPLPFYLYSGGVAKIPEWKCLATDSVNYVGEPIAAIVSDNRYLLEDMLERVLVDYEPMQVITDAERALETDSSFVHRKLGTNLALSIRMSGGYDDDIFRKANFVLRKKLRMHRHSPTPLEPRGVVASYDTRGDLLTVWASTQIPFILRSHLSRMLGIEERSIRVISPDVGGGFGAKLQVTPEYVVACILSRITGRPIKWIETRSESITTSSQAREQTHDIAAAFSASGELLALRDDAVINAGAYLDTRMSGQILTGAHALQGPYKTRAIKYDGNVVLTNKCPYGPFRGFGSEAGTFVLERILDTAARELHIDPIEIRKRNLIGPEEQPFRTTLGLVYDEANYANALDRVLQIADYSQLRKEQAVLHSKGRQIGIGLSFAIEPSSVNAYTGVPKDGETTTDPVDFGTSTLKMDNNGKLSVFVGTASIGSGHAAAIIQLATAGLGLTPNDIRILEGDTSATPYDCGVRASRFSPIVLPAVLQCLTTIRERLVRAAAHIWRCDPLQIELRDGLIFVKGSPKGQNMSIQNLARLFYTDMNLLPDLGCWNLEATSTFRPEKKGPFNTFSHSAHISMVEVDPETGKIKILRYFVVEDCGNIVSPQAVDGQICGGVTQVVGGVLFEEIKYGEDGQLLSDTFMDYLLPSALDAPEVVIEHIATPSSFPGGFKGMSESPNICGYASMVNAVEDALTPLSVKCDETRLFPSNVYEMINSSVIHRKDPIR